MWGGKKNGVYPTAPYTPLNSTDKVSDSLVNMAFSCKRATCFLKELVENKTELKRKVNVGLTFFRFPDT